MTPIRDQQKRQRDRAQRIDLKTEDQRADQQDDALEQQRDRGLQDETERQRQAADRRDAQALEKAGIDLVLQREAFEARR